MKMQGRTEIPLQMKMPQCLRMESHPSILPENHPTCLSIHSPTHPLSLPSIHPSYVSTHLPTCPFVPPWEANRVCLCAVYRGAWEGDCTDSAHHPVQRSSLPPTCADLGSVSLALLYQLIWWACGLCTCLRCLGCLLLPSCHFRVSSVLQCSVYFSFLML